MVPGMEGDASATAAAAEIAGGIAGAAEGLEATVSDQAADLDEHRTSRAAAGISRAVAAVGTQESVEAELLGHDEMDGATAGPAAGEV